MKNLKPVFVQVQSMNHSNDMPLPPKYQPTDPEAKRLDQLLAMAKYFLLTLDVIEGHCVCIANFPDNEFMKFYNTNCREDNWRIFQSSKDKILVLVPKDQEECMEVVYNYSKYFSDYMDYLSSIYEPPTGE